MDYCPRTFVPEEYVPWNIAPGPLSLRSMSHGLLPQDLCILPPGICPHSKVKLKAIYRQLKAIKMEFHKDTPPPFLNIFYCKILIKIVCREENHLTELGVQ